MKALLALVACFFHFSSAAQAAEIRPGLLESTWSADWVKVQDAPEKEYGIYHFRKTFELEEIPESFVIHVSADSRYKLFVNERMVSFGPAAGDYFHWNFETVDIASELRTGRNIVAALVWNEGVYRKEAQISHRTGFLLQGNTEREEILNTDASWKGIASEAYSPLPEIGYSTYYVAGPGERVDMNRFAKGWTGLEYDDRNWPQVEGVVSGRQGRGNPKGARDAFGWMLVPRPIPAMELREQRFSEARLIEGLQGDVSGLLEGLSPLRIPPNTEARVILDQGVLTNAFTKLRISSGTNASVKLGYAESLFEEISEQRGAIKGNRNEVAGKVFAGRRDEIISDGSSDQMFTSLSYRTFRYVELIVTTEDDELIIDALGSVFVGYPFEQVASFESDQDEIEKMLEIGWRTARLCAVETYMDCPYYEQLQYIGDARIQALVSLYNSGDDRLLRNALNLVDQSRLAEGVTLSRHPSTTPQIISTFSLWYIGMLHDYWWYGSDAAFVAEKLPGARETLRFFEKYQSEDGTLRKVPYWLFTDWVEGFRGWNYGEPPKGEEGESSVLDFQLLWAYQVAAEMESALGMEAFADVYDKRAAQLKRSIRERYWSDDRGLFRDTFAEDSPYSQHANILAILTDAVSESEARAIAQKLLSEKDLAKASIYFKYYLHLALTKAGLGNEYVDWLDKWRENMELGLTTWAENSNVSKSRSDCHAWGSSPNIEFYRTVLGIDSTAPGFKEVTITPRLGALKSAKGSIPHPDGIISVSYIESGGSWTVEVSLPDSVSGQLDWKGTLYPLQGDENQFTF